MPLKRCDVLNYSFTYRTKQQWCRHTAEWTQFNNYRNFSIISLCIGMHSPTSLCIMASSHHLSHRGVIIRACAVNGRWCALKIVSLYLMLDEIGPILHISTPGSSLRMSEQSGLGELLKDIPSKILDQQCSDRFLADVAGEIVAWQTLAPYFDISRGEKQSIRESCSTYDEEKQEFLFKWKEKNPRCATNRALLEAIHSSNAINLVHHACQILQQKYCQATASGVVATQAVSPLLLEFQSKLKMKYSTHKPVMVTEWPPPCSLDYIKLVLVPKKQIERGEISNDDVYARFFRNDDEAMDTSEEVNIEQLLAIDNSKRKVILFQGAAGSGKSTLLWHVCQMWQSGEQFQHFTLVMLVQLKDPAVRTAKSLAELVPSRSHQYSQRVASEIEAICGEGVLLMLDGWDEAPAELREEGSFFHDLIAKPSDWSVEKAAIVVSSRPLTSDDDLWVYLSERVALQGFTREMREKYIREALPESSEDAQCLIDNIESAETTDSIDFSHPLNIASLVHIFQTSGGDLPPTPCRIAIKLVLSFLFRHIKKTLPKGKKSMKALNSFEDLPQPVRDRFQQICKIAYDGMANEKFTFTSEELVSGGMGQIASCTDGDEGEVETLSLLQPECSLMSVGTSTVYHFLHLSQQELCAAYHVSRLPDPEETHVNALGVILRARKFYAFECVGKFYSALTSLNVPSIAQNLRFLYGMSDKQTENSSQEVTYTQSSDVNSESDLEWHSDSSEEREAPTFESSEGSDGYVEWERDFLYNVRDCCVATLRGGSGYFFPLFLEFARESMNPKFIDDSIGKEARMHIDRDTEPTSAALVSMSSSLESVTYYMHFISSTMFTALRNKQKLKIFAVYVFRCISDCGHFEAMKDALPTCPNLEDVYMRVRFSENISQMSVITQTFQHMQLKKLNIHAQSSIKDTQFAELAPAFMGTSYVSIKCKEVGSHGLAKLKDVLLHSNSLNCLEMQIEQYGGEDKEFFGCLRAAQSIHGIVLYSKDWTISSLHDGEPSLVDSAVGRVLLSGDLVQLAQIFGLNEPSPVVDKILHVHIFNSCLKIDFKKECFKSVSLVECHHKPNRLFQNKKVMAVKNKIKLNGVQMLCMSLQSIAVEELNLMGHEIGDIGASVFKDTIPTFLCLTELIIRKCNIGEAGIAAVFAGLTQNKTLTTLDAAYNNFGDSGAIHIAKLINQTSLEVLDIGNCGIGEGGIAAIAASLRTNTTLKRLGLYSDNQVLTQHSETELSRLLLQNRTLCVLQVNQNHPIDWPGLYRDRVNRRFAISQASMQCLMMNTDAREVYRAVKVSSVIASVEVDRTSSLGQAIDSGNTELAADILQLDKLPLGKGRIKLNMDDGKSWTVDYHRKCVSSDDS